MGFISITYGEEPLTTLKEITYQRIDGKLEVTIEIEGEFEYDVFELYVPPRLVIDVWKVQEMAVEPETEVNEANVLKIRIGEYQPEVARIVFDLQEPIPSYNVERIDKGLKIIFSLEKIPEKLEEKVKPEKVKKIELPPKKVEKKLEKKIPEIVERKRAKRSYRQEEVWVYS